MGIKELSHDTESFLGELFCSNGIFINDYFIFLLAEVTAQHQVGRGYSITFCNKSVPKCPSVSNMLNTNMKQRV